VSFAWLAYRSGLRFFSAAILKDPSSSAVNEKISFLSWHYLSKKGVNSIALQLVLSFTSAPKSGILIKALLFIMEKDPVRIAGYVVYVIYVITSIWLMLNAIIQVHLLWHYKKKRRGNDSKGAIPAMLPFISIQVPVYNERYVISRLLRALSAFEYPKDKFEIQVLDDSDDETVELINQEAAKLGKAGFSISVLRRDDRSGFKAGALQAGLARCKGELIAIFDADFIPEPHFLRKLIPHFSNPTTGMVQARWGHLNREQNHLTRAQTLLLDTHFSIEQVGRSNAGYFTNFCGTAGIWRKQCILEAGGWDGTVLSEDLDLSYRAQLKGWKMVYDDSIEVPAELPSVMEAFKIQQFRWTKGMAQIFKKTMSTLLHTPMPLAKKIHGIFHLLGSFVFVCLLLNAILMLPLLVLRTLYPEFVTLTEYTIVNSLNLVTLTLFYYNGTRSTQKQEDSSFWRSYPLFLVLYMGLAVQNSIAVLQGLFGSSSPFVRTPKFNATDPSATTYHSRKFTRINYLEGGMLCYFLAGIAISFFTGDFFMLLFFVMMSAGLSFILFYSEAPTRDNRLSPNFG
jgi:cellulose synthase/poly-beta-1,6-N-acetylglucosamine synthase-like glycosyltransferase